MSTAVRGRPRLRALNKDLAATTDTSMTSSTTSVAAILTTVVTASSAPPPSSSSVSNTGGPRFAVKSFDEIMAEKRGAKAATTTTTQQQQTDNVQATPTPSAVPTPTPSATAAPTPAAATSVPTAQQKREALMARLAEKKRQEQQQQQQQQQTATEEKQQQRIARPTQPTHSQISTTVASSTEEATETPVIAIQPSSVPSSSSISDASISISPSPSPSPPGPTTAATTTTPSGIGGVEITRTARQPVKIKPVPSSSIDLTASTATSNIMKSGPSTSSTTTPARQPGAPQKTNRNNTEKPSVDNIAQQQSQQYRPISTQQQRPSITNNNNKRNLDSLDVKNQTATTATTTTSSSSASPAAGGAVSGISFDGSLSLSSGMTSQPATKRLKRDMKPGSITGSTMNKSSAVSTSDFNHSLNSHDFNAFISKIDAYITQYEAELLREQEENPNIGPKYDPRAPLPHIDPEQIDQLIAEYETFFNNADQMVL